MTESLDAQVARDAQRIAEDHARVRTEPKTDKPSPTEKPATTPNRDQGRPKWATKR